MEMEEGVLKAGTNGRVFESEGHDRWRWAAAFGLSFGREWFATVF